MDPRPQDEAVRVYLLSIFTTPSAYIMLGTSMRVSTEDVDVRTSLRSGLQARLITLRACREVEHHDLDTV